MVDFAVFDLVLYAKASGGHNSYAMWGNNLAPPLAALSTTAKPASRRLPVTRGQRNTTTTWCVCVRIHLMVLSVLTQHCSLRHFCSKLWQKEPIIFWRENSIQNISLNK